MARIYGLHYDFISGGGTHLIITPPADRELKIIPHQVQMLKRNRIPGLLPFDCEDWNGTHRLFYDVTSKRNLFMALRAMAPDQAAVLETAYRLVKIVTDSAAYLLNETHYVLQEDFIYVGDRTAEPLLIYLPVEQPDKPPLAEELRRLILRLLSCARTLEGGHIPRLVDALLKDEIAPEELKELLKGMWIQPIAAGRRLERQPEPALRTGNRKTSAWETARQWLADMLPANRTERALPGEPSAARRTLRQAKAELPAAATAMEQRPAATDGKTQMLSAASAKSGSPKKWRLCIKKPDGEEIVEMAEDRFLIGRSRSGVHYMDPSDGISRVHCEFVRSESGLEVKDLGSLNGTLLNGEPLIPFKAYPFGAGDRVELLSTEIRLAE